MTGSAAAAPIIALLTQVNKFEILHYGKVENLIFFAVSYCVWIKLTIKHWTDTAEERGSIWTCLNLNMPRRVQWFDKYYTAEEGSRFNICTSSADLDRGSGISSAFFWLLDTGSGMEKKPDQDHISESLITIKMHLWFIWGPKKSRFPGPIPVLCTRVCWEVSGPIPPLQCG